jgi:uncharacterized CHY-type Zn-finger protein
MPSFIPGSPCPRCGAPIVASARALLLTCERCDFIPGITPLDEPIFTPANEAAIDAPPPTMHAVKLGISYTGELSPRARSLYETGVVAQARGDTDEAIRNYQRALEMHPDFTDAHLAIARLSDDPHVKHEHLSAALAYDPGNAEALRLWMLLKGALTPEGAARAEGDAAPELRAADGTVTTKTTALICPVCGGHLTVDEVNHQVTCRFCGHQAPQQTRREIGAQSLGMALIARKAEPVRWLVKERLLHCNRCGAERVIANTTLSMQCPFCGSNQVIQQDAKGSFVQPDGLIPFRLAEQDVIGQIKAALDTPLEKLAGVFDDNRVRSGVIEGVFVPFWVFDVVVNIVRIQTPKQREVGYGMLRTLQQPREERFTDAIFNLPILGLREVDDGLVRQIQRYEFSDVVPYQPQLLAKYPASLYDVDFDRASLSAGGDATRHMNEKHQYLGEGDNIRVNSSVSSMTFSLLLLPLFIVTLKERDGDQRPALVNGQTGAVAFGRTQKKRR